MCPAKLSVLSNGGGDKACFKGGTVTPDTSVSTVSKVSLVTKFSRCSAAELHGRGFTPAFTFACRPSTATFVTSFGTSIVVPVRMMVRMKATPSTENPRVTLELLLRTLFLIQQQEL